MNNDYSRACKDIAQSILSTSGMASMIPGIEQTLRLAATQIEILGQEEQRRLFWEMVAGRGPKSQVHAMIYKNPAENYGQVHFKKNERSNTTLPEPVRLMGWYYYLLLNKQYITGELADYALPYHFFSYGYGSTRFCSPLKVINPSGHSLSEFETIYPDFTIERVYYTNELEQVERTDLNVLLNVTPVAYVDYAQIGEEYLHFCDRMEGGAFEALKNDNPGTPDWAELTVVGQYRACDEVVVTIENFTVSPTTKQPLAFKLSFYRDEEEQLCYTTNYVAYAFLNVKQSYWQNLPFLIRRLIGQLDIVGQGTYCTDYEVRDNDVFVLNPQYTPNSMEQHHES